MREWSLKTGDPLCLTLASDARLSPPDYTDDQIWEAALGGGEPSALAVQTTYGLRARQMVIFPRFQEDEEVRIDPLQFTSPPVLKSFFPNCLHFKLQPFNGLDAAYILWAATPQVLAGRMELVNTSILPKKLRLDFTALLSPLETSLGMAFATMENDPVLQGKTSNLRPVLLLDGAPGAGPGPYPTLGVEIELSPGTRRTVKWALASTGETQESYRQAKRFLAQEWDPEFSRIELVNAQHTLEIYTGDADWDAAFAFSQKTAYQLLQGNPAQLPHLSFVLSRQPDYGYSLRKDGSEYNYLWNGQTSLDAFFLSGFFLPGGAAVLEGILRNFLAVQSAKGFIDWKPGLGGQRGHMLAQPVLASLAWRLYQTTQNRNFLSEIFQPLYNFFTAWFYPEHDRDGDGLPEYDHLLQSGFEGNPFFNRWLESDQVVEINCVEDPALGAFLYRECATLIRMAQTLSLRDKLHQLENFQKSLSRQIEQCWDEKRSTYQYRDRDTHASPPGILLHQASGPGVYPLEARFDEPRRISICLQDPGEATRQTAVKLTGETKNGEASEEFNPRSIQWLEGKAWITTQSCYLKLTQVEVTGLSPSGKVRIQTVDFTREDQTLLLPLWAGIPRYKQAQAIVAGAILNPERYGGPAGIPALPGSRGPDDSTEVSLIWNDLIGEGLVAGGYRKEAAELVKNLMGRLVENLKAERSFRRMSQNGEKRISSERNHLACLAPMRLYLDVLGVEILTPTRVLLEGQNPFPGVVTLKYRGLTVAREPKLTRVTFPNGQTTTWNGLGPHLLSLA